MTTTMQSGPSPVGGGPAPFQDPDEFLADVGDRIRAERLARGWTQARLADAAGLKRERIKVLEAGSDSLTAYAATCRAFGHSLDYLLSDRWSMPDPASRALTPRQVAVLVESAAGGTLAEVARRLGTTREVVGARMSEVYRRLGVSGLPVGRRREAALRVARSKGLIPEGDRIDSA